MICARVATAISAGLAAPISRPMGAAILASLSSVMPEAARRSSRLARSFRTAWTSVAAMSGHSSPTPIPAPRAILLWTTRFRAARMSKGRSPALTPSPTTTWNRKPGRPACPIRDAGRLTQKSCPRWFPVVRGGRLTTGTTGTDTLAYVSGLLAVASGGAETANKPET